MSNSPSYNQPASNHPCKDTIGTTGPQQRLASHSQILPKVTGASPRSKYIYEKVINHTLFQKMDNAVGVPVALQSFVELPIVALKVEQLGENMLDDLAYFLRKHVATSNGHPLFEFFKLVHPKH